MKEKISFRTQECLNSNCRFRFPVLEGKTTISVCPKCNTPLQNVGIPYERHSVKKSQFLSPSFEMHLLLDNIRSLYNVGSVFRTAEAIGVQKLHLCGMTATPNNPRLAKTAIGAEKMLAWQYYNNAVEAGKKLREDGFSLWAIEGGDKSTSLFEAKRPQQDDKIALVIGNELAGVDPEIMEVCEEILYIPMQGDKESLNLTVAFGIAAYFLRHI